MKIKLNILDSVEENAGFYFEKAKKIKRRIKGAEEALQNSLKDLEKLEHKSQKEEKLKSTVKRTAKKEWYEKFRWFVSSEGFLVVGGRDATTNEIIIKKYAEKDDVVFHTDMAGSPFFVIKAGGKKIGEKTLKEVADATCSYSRAFKLGMANTPVFYVGPEQVTKQAESGEYLTKGAFVIRGKTNYIDNKIDIAIGITKEGRVMGGPLDSIKANCENFVEIIQGTDKTSSLAKLIQKKIGGGLDEIIRAMPAGGCKIKK